MGVLKYKAFVTPRIIIIERSNFGDLPELVIIRHYYTRDIHKQTNLSYREARHLIHVFLSFLESVWWESDHGWLFPVRIGD